MRAEQSLPGASRGPSDLVSCGEADLLRIRKFVRDQGRPKSADRLVQQIRSTAKTLLHLPESGSPVLIQGRMVAREVYVADYRIMYRWTETIVEVVRVLHGARFFPE